MPHRPILETRHLHWPAEADCEHAARRLATAAALRDAFVALHGPLGAGKTTFVRHLLHALGVHGRIKSPTYAVLEPHDLEGLAISHFDFYRYDDAAHDADDDGFRDVFAQPGLKLAEWPERAGAWLPAADLTLTIEPQDDGSRRVAAEAGSDTGRALAAALA